jgi:hypothetical protein
MYDCTIHRQRKQNAQAVSLAVDGAIVHAQIDQTPDAALSTLDRIIKSLLNEKHPTRK